MLTFFAYFVVKLTKFASHSFCLRLEPKGPTNKINLNFQTPYKQLKQRPYSLTTCVAFFHYCIDTVFVFGNLFYSEGGQT